MLKEGLVIVHTMFHILAHDSWETINFMAEDGRCWLVSQLATLPTTTFCQLE